jgi:hypothetical protein
MDSSFFRYLQQLEMMGFFSGYPLVYTIVLFIVSSRPKNIFAKRMVMALPFAYALTGTLYLGMQLHSLYPDYSYHNIMETFQQPWLVLWAVLSVLFWIPSGGRIKILALLHSFVFFFIVLKDIFLHISSTADKNILKNDMSVYTSSLLLNTGTLLFITLMSFLFWRKKNRA